MNHYAHAHQMPENVNSAARASSLNRLALP